MRTSFCLWERKFDTGHWSCKSSSEENPCRLFPAESADRLCETRPLQKPRCGLLHILQHTCTWNTGFTNKALLCIILLRRSSVCPLCLRISAWKVTSFQSTVYQIRWGEVLSIVNSLISDQAGAATWFVEMDQIYRVFTKHNCIIWSIHCYSLSFC